MKKAEHSEPLSGLGVPSQPAEPQAAERWTVDGLEDSPGGRLARLEQEDGTTFDLPLRFLPAGLREGDLLEVQAGPQGVTLRLLPAETAARRGALQAQLDALNDAGASWDGPEEITL